MIKNQDVTWVSLAQDLSIANAFTRKTATKVLLTQGMVLYKLANGTTVEKYQKPGLVTEWWSPYDAYDYDPGWEERIKLAKHLGVNIRELSRVVVAVKENWSTLAYLLRVELCCSVYGFFGGVAGQARLDPAKASKRLPGEGSSGSKGLVGSASQFYIPNLVVADMKLLEARKLIP